MSLVKNEINELSFEISKIKLTGLDDKFELEEVRKKETLRIVFRIWLV